MAHENLIRLVEVMDRLRSPGGCPWDGEQSHESLLKYLLEESYEFIESVENKDRAHMREELGDLLLQVYFHSRIAEEDKHLPTASTRSPFSSKNSRRTAPSKNSNATS